MAAFGGGVAQLRALPFPLRVAAGVLAIIVLIWLARWLGGAAILLAVVLWAAALIGVLHAGGRLPWADRYPALARMLAMYAPRAGYASPIVSAGGKAAPVGATVRKIEIPDISGFVGIDDVKYEIDALIESRSALSGTVAPATLVLLVGPRGTGKSSVALAMAASLRSTGIVKTDKIVPISEIDLPGLSDSYGPGADVLKSISDRALMGLDGVVLLDDLDRMISLSSGSVALETGTRLLAVARGHPGRLFMIGTGSSEAVTHLDPAKRWLGQFNVRRVLFPALDDAALKTIFLRLLAAQGCRLASDAERALAIRIREIRQEGGDEFDNAHASRRLVDNVLFNYGLRLRQHPESAAAARGVIVADDVRAAYSSV